MLLNASTLGLQGNQLRLQNYNKNPNLPNIFDFGSSFSLTTSIESAVTLVCLVLMSVSGFWSPVRFPALWTVLFCVLLLAGLLGEYYLAVRVYGINLYEQTHLEIISAVIRIKRCYKYLELFVSGCVIVLIAWITVISPLVNSRMELLLWWGILFVGFVGEYFLYRRSICDLQMLEKWTDD